MFRPEQMSRVSITGTQANMEPVIEAMHDLNLVHLIEYDGSWTGFENGNSLKGADRVAQMLVTVRALENTLGLEGEAPTISVDDAELDDRLEEVRQRINSLDDRRTELREERRRIREHIDDAKPFVDVGIDLDLLSGYDSVSVAVGNGDPDAIRETLESASEIEAYEIFPGDRYLAVVAYPAVSIGDALVGTPFTQVEVPDPTDLEDTNQPEVYVERLRERAAGIDSELETVEAEFDDVRDEVGDFLLAAERKLTIKAQKLQAPLGFATSDHTFLVEGWIPTSRYQELVTTLEETVGDHVAIEELERASYDSNGHAVESEPVETDEEPADESAVAADGGHEAEAQRAPPVIQDNPGPAKPFEALVNAINRPKYSEIDPTLIVFLTFPIAFGFMIGDIGYGLLYMAMGYALWQVDNDVVNALGSVAVWAGVFTVIFGYLYDDLFGVHLHDLGLALPLAGVLDKGIQATEWALLWVVVSILFGIAHLSLGFVLGFLNDRAHHGTVDAALENLSWVLGLNGFFIWLFSMHTMDVKPDFLVGDGAVLAEFVGFAGFSQEIGLLGLVIMFAGIAGAVYAERVIGLVEIPTKILAHALSYLRIVAVLIAKGGMAFTVNLLTFGAYEVDGYTHFHLALPGTEMPAGVEPQFFGLIHLDPLPLGILLAVVIFVLGHILVLLLGITAAGIQMIRLEYVEFFEKFYEGGGDPYEPFGYRTAYKGR